MTTRKRNEFLDPVSSEDEGSEAGYDSEAAEETKGLKRRRTETSRGFLDNDDDEEEEEEEEEGEEGERSDGGESDEEDAKISRSKGKGKKAKKTGQDDDDDDDEEDDDQDEDQDEGIQEGQYLDVTAESNTTKTKKILNPKPLDKTKPPKKNKTGVIYFSTLPPYLRPFALKSLIERSFGPITKVFLSPAVPSASAPRRRSNKRKTYSDGWVEFASKKTAKICAETLNATIIGGKKGGWYHDDVWNMRYLRGFKWADLMEQVQRERSERDAKRRVEDARAKKEEKVFVSGVEKGKVLEGMQRKNEEKRARKQQQQQSEGQEEPQQQQQQQQPPQRPEKNRNVRRLFKQNEVKSGRDKIKDADVHAAMGDDAKRVLGKIF